MPLRASYSFLQSIFKRSINRNKIFSTGSIFSEKFVPGGTIFSEKIGPGPKFSAEQNFRDISSQDQFLRNQVSAGRTRAWLKNLLDIQDKKYLPQTIFTRNYIYTMVNFPNYGNNSNDYHNSGIVYWITKNL